MNIGVRDRGAGGGGDCQPKILETMEIRANARKNQGNSGKFIRK